MWLVHDIECNYDVYVYRTDLLGYKVLSRLIAVFSLASECHPNHSNRRIPLHVRMRVRVVTFHEASFKSCSRAGSLKYLEHFLLSTKRTVKSTRVSSGIHISGYIALEEESSNDSSRGVLSTRREHSKDGAMIPSVRVCSISVTLHYIAESEYSWMEFRCVDGVIIPARRKALPNP